MTHDELKAKIYEVPSSVYLMSAKTNDIYPTSNIYSKSTKNRLVEALVAVVELHKSKIDQYGEEVCGYCSEITFYSEMEEESYLYPCPTIQAIEDVLK